MTGQTEDRFQRMVREPEARPLRKRFYEEVAVAGDAAPHGLLLDGRPVRTPMRRSFAVPRRALAEAVAMEWRCQGERIDPALMPLTRLANTAIDRVEGREQHVVAEISGYAGSDLVCYRAEGPEALVRREAAHWDPILTWAELRLAHPFIVVSGLIPRPQPAPTLAAVAAHVAGHDAFALTALHNLTSLTGSALIAMAVEAGELAADAAWTAAHVDEDWQIEQWGADEEAARRRQARRRDFDAAVALLTLLRSTA